MTNFVYQIMCLPIGISFYNVGKTRIGDSILLCFDVDEEDATMLILSGNYRIMSGNSVVLKYSESFIRSQKTVIKKHGIDIKSWLN